MTNNFIRTVPHTYIYIYSGKLCFYGLLRSRGGECERGKVERSKCFARAHGPPPFLNPLRENGAQTRLQKTLSKSTRHTGAKFGTQGPQSKSERILWAFWTAKELPNGCRNGEKSDASKSVIFATPPIRNPWFQLPGHPRNP